MMLPPDKYILSLTAVQKFCWLEQRGQNYCEASSTHACMHIHTQTRTHAHHIPGPGVHSHAQEDRHASTMPAHWLLLASQASPGHLYHYDSWDQNENRDLFQMEKIKASLQGATAYFLNSKWSSTLGSFENYFWKFKMLKRETPKTFKLCFIGFEKAKVFGSQLLSLNTLSTEKHPTSRLNCGKLWF